MRRSSDTGIRPVFATRPTTETKRLFISSTMMVTSGESRCFESLRVISSLTSSGVRPAATTSSISGTDTLPSGRTGTSTLTAAFCHTLTRSRSLTPIT